MGLADPNRRGFHPVGGEGARGTAGQFGLDEREVEAIGGRVVKQWALLGAYDFLSVVEAPDERTIAQLTVDLTSRGSATFETLTAIPAEDLVASLEPVDPI